MPGSVVLLVVCLLLLAGGAEGFARGLWWIGLPARWRFLVNALISSAPALAVGLTAGFMGYPRTAVAVLIGSHIANVGLVLSLATLARPLHGTSAELRMALLLPLLAVLLAWFLARDGTLSQTDGGILLVAGVGVMVLSGRRAAPHPASAAAATLFSGMGIGAALGWMIGAAVLFVNVGLEEVVRLARVGGIVFGLTAIAAGLSLRGIVAAILAARKGEGDSILQGVAGGSVLNLLLGLGILSLGVPVPLDNRMLMDVFPAATVAALFLLANRFNGLQTRRWEGLLQLAAYIGFVLWLRPRG